MKTKPIFILILCHILYLQGAAQPDLSSKEIIQDMAIYRDSELPNKFYYAPLSFQLDRDVDGKPNFSFVRMTHLNGRARDLEAPKQSSVIQFTIEPKYLEQSRLQEIRSMLKERICAQCKILFVPAPIRKTEASLIYTNLDTEKSTLVESNHHSAPKTKRFSERWTSKTFTIRPDVFTSQVLWDAFKNNKGILSVAYGIWTLGDHADEVTYDFSGPKELEDVFIQMNKGTNDSTETRKKNEALINAGAFQITIDQEAWPDQLKEIDFGSTLSPRYGLVDVYCHDFVDNIRPDLLAKLVEFEATGVGNGTVKTEMQFSKAHPDVYAYAIKFEYAIRLDHPLRYRVIEISETGEITTGEWIKKENWNSIIDISSKKNFEEALKSEEK